jgi:hypothetical protein
MSASLQFQVALLEKRLHAVAIWQLERAKEGWRTTHVEWDAPPEAALIVDGVPMGLRGRIDRVDQRGDTVQILDYKVITGDRTPRNTHKSGGAWIDLQLPLYEILAREILQGRTPELGYVRISDTPTMPLLAIAGWSAGEIAEAHEVAREVVRKIRAGAFDEKGDDPPGDGVFGNIFGTEVLEEEAGE